MNTTLLLLLSFSIMAAPCDIFFIPSELYTQRVVKAFAPRSEFPDKAYRVIQSLSLEDKVELLTLIKSIDVKAKKRLTKLIKNEPEVFQRDQATSFNRIYIESIIPGFAKKAYANAESFSPSDYSSKFKIPTFLEGVKVTSKDKKFRAAFKSINKFFNEQRNVFARMQEFEEEVIARSLRENSNFYSLSDEAQALIKQRQMINVLDQLEEKNGFVSNSKSHYKALDLLDKTYDLDEWQKMLREGKMFNDTSFKTAQSSAQLSGRTSHGYFTHRIQWHILMQQMEQTPESFKNFKAVELFKKLGDTKYANKMGLGTSSSNTLWEKLFDSQDGPSYHSPEYFRTMHELYPYLGAWL